MCRAQWKQERFAISFRVGNFDLDPRNGFRFPPVQQPFAHELEDLDAHVATLQHRSADMGVVVSVRDWSIFFDKSEPTLHDVNVEIMEKSSVCSAPTAAGKSTLLMLMAGLIRPTSGTVEVDGVAASGVGAHTHRQRGAHHRRSGSLPPPHRLGEPCITSGASSSSHEMRSRHGPARWQARTHREELGLPSSGYSSGMRQKVSPSRARSCSTLGCFCWTSQRPIWILWPRARSIGPSANKPSRASRS